jgi:uncharacterized membrane protein
MGWGLADFIWSLIVFFFWIALIAMFIMVFADIFRRDDLSGLAKAGWVLLLVVFPLIGVLVYVIVRPRMTEQDRRIAAEEYEQDRRLESHSAPDEVAKLAKLRDDGEISAEEYERLKARAML